MTPKNWVPLCEIPRGAPTLSTMWVLMPDGSLAKAYRSFSIAYGSADCFAIRTIGHRVKIATKPDELKMLVLPLEEI